MMETTVLKKMRLKTQAKIRAFFAPQEFQDCLQSQTDFSVVTDDAATVFICFVTNQAEYAHHIQSVLPLMTSDKILWIGYKKSNKKYSYDINRDSLVTLAKSDNLTPCGMVSLSDEWSLLRFKITS